MTKTIGTFFGDMNYPLSEQTIKNHNYHYKGRHYINDLGHPCEYRVEVNGEDLGVMVKYYKGRLLTEYMIKK